MKNKLTNKSFKHISPLSIINLSGFYPKQGEIEVAKKHCYTIIENISVTGDAPKDIIRYYEFGKALKKSYKNWSIYIAKLGHKYYPMESITEQLISDIGSSYGFKMANSKICFIGGQIRFFSLYFLDNKNEELFHGADIYAGFLNNDIEFVDEVEDKKMTQDFFTIEFTKKVIKHSFPNENTLIFNSFMRMLFFDGLVGNNDRHMYNWGVVRDIFGEQNPYFSQIYDTARGLLWNMTDMKINDIVKDKNSLQNSVKKYCNNSKPKIGIENEKFVNHFKLIDSYKEHYKNDDLIMDIFDKNMIYKVIKLLNSKYKKLISNNRRLLITEILKYRFDKLKEILDYEQ